MVSVSSHRVCAEVHLRNIKISELKTKPIEISDESKF